MAVEECLELEAVPIAIEVLQQNLAAAERPAALGSAIPDDRSEQIDLAQSTEPLAKRGRFNAVAAGIGRIEIGLSACRVRMPCYESNDRPATMRLFDQPPERGGHGVAETLAEAFDKLQAGRGGARLGSKAIGQKKKLPGREVRFGFHNGVAGRCEGLLGIAQHHSGMPWNDVMTNLVGFIPAMLERREILVEQNPLLIGKIECLEAQGLNGLAQDCRALENLQASNLHAREHFSQETVVRGAVIAAIEFQEIPNNAQVYRRLGIAKATQNFGNLSVDVGDGAVSETNVLHFTRLGSCSLSTATNTSRAELSSGVSLCTASERAAKRTAS